MNENTFHKILNCDSSKKEIVQGNSIDLIVTSPPYPMIEMWDTLILNNSDSLSSNHFNVFHKNLNKIWKNSYYWLKEGGIICINIGDATRSIDGDFQLFPNSAQISINMKKIGFIELPKIIWNKSTNTPNKFLGSGTMPDKPYVTLEYEDILIFKKPGRKSNIPIKENRWKSSFFCVERNKWCNCIWKFNGTSQSMELNERKRNGAFPYELPNRLINMFSFEGDVVLDPFSGIGTTALAALANKRNSISIELIESYSNYIKERLMNSKSNLNLQINNRFNEYEKWVKNYSGKLLYKNNNINLRVKTKNESYIKKNKIKVIEKNRFNENEIVALYE